VTAGREERSADELDQELRAALDTIDERRVAEDRPATTREIAELERLVHAVHDADVNEYREQHQIGDHYYFPRGPNPPEFPHEWWERTKVQLGEPPPGADFRARLAQTPTAPVEQPAAEVSPQRKRLGKAYDAAIAATIVRRVANGVPSRALRDAMYREGVGTTPLIDHILDLTRDRRKKDSPYRRLSVTRRRHWERAAGELIEDGTVTLDELTKRLK
jgi:hypothetical protein